MLKIFMFSLKKKNIYIHTFCEILCICNLLVSRSLAVLGKRKKNMFGLHLLDMHKELKHKLSLIEDCHSSFRVESGNVLGFVQLSVLKRERASLATFAVRFY